MTCIFSVSCPDSDALWLTWVSWERWYLTVFYSLLLKRLCLESSVLECNLTKTERKWMLRRLKSNPAKLTEFSFSIRIGKVGSTDGMQGLLSPWHRFPVWVEVCYGINCQLLQARPSQLFSAGSSFGIFSLKRRVNALPVLPAVTSFRFYPAQLRIPTWHKR